MRHNPKKKERVCCFWFVPVGGRESRVEEFGVVVENPDSLKCDKPNTNSTRNHE
jgi:hypothetical protein